MDNDQLPPERKGLVLFFTGLSGSGKSTLARALMDRLLEQGGRTITSLDGDVVRRNLSAGLSFSKEDRETNIRRIGWVAAEISRHGGIAVCSPIAPFDETRQQVRAMVDEAGGAFFLVHVATPLEECERRDRKGLYAKARRGEIPEFTGISSPYEEPADADVRVDTTGRSIEAALDDVIVALRDAGYVDLAPAAGAAGPPQPSQPPADTTPADTMAASIDATPSTASSIEARERIHILFVCTANICRSPFMELTARDLAGPGASVTFASAGTHGFREHPMDTVMGKALGSRGVSNDDFLSQPLSASLIEDADLVLTAEATHRTFILDDHPSSFRKVFTLGQFAEAVRTLGPELEGRKLLRAAGGRPGRCDHRARRARPLRSRPRSGRGVRHTDRRAPARRRACRDRNQETHRMSDLLSGDFSSILVAGFIVGIVVGLTGMGGGALMTPALIFLGVGDTAKIVTADLTAAAIYKTGGAIVHSREGSPNWALAKWLIIGSVPMAFLGPHLLAGVVDPEDIDDVLKTAIGFALLVAASTYALRLYINLRRVRAGGGGGDPDPRIRPIPTMLVGALGGLLVGITSVGSGSVIMVALLMLYPGLSAVKLVGTDLVQAVPLVLAAAISNIVVNGGLDMGLTVPLVLGSVPGTIIGSKIAPRVPQSFIRRGHRRGADHVRCGPARQGRLGAAGARRDAPDPDRGHRLRDDRAGAPDLGAAPQGAGAADVRRPDRGRARGSDVPRQEPATPVLISCTC